MSNRRGMPVPVHSVRRRVGLLMAVALVAVQLAAAHARAPEAEAAQALLRSAPDLALPWSHTETWRLTGGPHSHVGRGRPWSSLDFAGPLRGGAYRVTAAASGTIFRPCPNLVQVRHGDGWTTSYYHLKDVTVRSGQRVQRGQLLGFTSTRSGCGGSATGSHVHFTIMFRGDPVNVAGLRIGGWTVREGTSQYIGCVVRATERRCSPGGRVRNFGN